MSTKKKSSKKGVIQKTVGPELLVSAWPSMEVTSEWWAFELASTEATRLLEYLRAEEPKTAQQSAVRQAEIERVTNRLKRLEEIEKIGPHHVTNWDVLEVSIDPQSNSLNSIDIKYSNKNRDAISFLIDKARAEVTSPSDREMIWAKLYEFAERKPSVPPLCDLKAGVLIWETQKGVLKRFSKKALYQRLMRGGKATPNGPL